MRLSLKYLNFQYKLKVLIATIVMSSQWVGYSFALEAIPDIAQTPLTLTPTMNPNVMILFDDSGSMDFEIMTSDALSSGLFFAPQPDGANAVSNLPNLQITRRNNCDVVTATFGGYAYGVAAPTNVYTDSTDNNCLVAAADAWRFRTAAYNQLYFDPNQVYQPWVGFRVGADGSAAEFQDIDPSDAPFDPFNLSLGTIDLLSTDLVVGNFRYYTWNDFDGDGQFENGEETEFLINVASSKIKQNFANWFSYYRSRHLRAKALLGQFIVSQVGTRIGLVRFNFSQSPSLPAVEMNGSSEMGAKRRLLDAIYGTQPAQLTTLVNERSPLHKRYIAVAEYLSCNDNDNDIFHGKVECPAEPGLAGTCQANHIIVTSDGFIDNFPFTFEQATQSIGNADADSSNEYDGGVFADLFMNTLSDIAISYYEVDLHPAIPDKIVLVSEDLNRYPSSPPNLDANDFIHQHIKTHVFTFGVAIPLNADAKNNINLSFPAVSANQSFVWSNPKSSDFGLLQDLVHAAYSGRGQYVDVTMSIDEVINETDSVSATITPGVGATVPAAINTQITEGNFILYRTFFDSSSISGDLVAQQITAEGVLNSKNGEPIFEWSAAEQLDVTVGINGENFFQRNIVTYSDDDGSGQAAVFNFNNLSASQQSLLTESQLNFLRGETIGEGIINARFRVRSETASTGGDVNHFAKLGSIANAVPVFIGSPQGVGRYGGAWPSADGHAYADFQVTQAGREPTVLVAANDGMFHAFNAENGRERFAYVPELVFDQLFRLSKQDYRHQFYVDSTPSVNDAYIKSSATASSPTWNTVAVGGLGAGGSGYYAINITHVDNVRSTADALETVMWEFGPEDDPGAQLINGEIISDLGLSFGRPIIGMSNIQDSAANQRWVAIFGNGYNSTSTSGNAVIYILLIDEGLDGIWSGTDLVKIDTGMGGADDGFNTPNGIADVRAIDTDGNGTIDRLYAGDLRGNLHVVDLSSEFLSNWDNASNRFVLFEATHQATGDLQAITTSPIVVPVSPKLTTKSIGAGSSEINPVQSQDGYIVVFTTGKFFTKTDGSSTEIQSIYGIFDDLSGTQVNANTLVEQTLSNEVADSGVEARIITDKPVTLGIQEDASNINGWFVDLDVPTHGSTTGVQFPGERSVQPLLLINEALFVNTIIPQTLSCEPGPGGFGLVLNPFTGGVSDTVIFDINFDGVFDENDNINVGDDDKMVVGTRFDSTPSAPTFAGNFRIVQQVNGEIAVDRINPSALDFEKFSGRRSWREVVF